MFARPVYRSTYCPAYSLSNCLSACGLEKCTYTQKKKKKKVTKKNNNRKCLKNFFKRIMYLKDAEEMTNIADPDQTAPEEGAVCSESALFLKPICTNM